jgi:hypothetical protein
MVGDYEVGEAITVKIACRNTSGIVDAAIEILHIGDGDIRGGCSRLCKK